MELGFDYADDEMSEENEKEKENTSSCIDNDRSSLSRDEKDVLGSGTVDSTTPAMIDIRDSSASVGAEGSNQLPHPAVQQNLPVSVTAVLPGHFVPADVQGYEPFIHTAARATDVSTSGGLTGLVRYWEEDVVHFGAQLRFIDFCCARVL